MSVEKAVAFAMRIERRYGPIRADFDLLGCITRYLRRRPDAEYEDVLDFVLESAAELPRF